MVGFLIPDREGYLKWNSDPNFKSDWIKTIEQETHLRREVMKKAIKSRGETVPKVKTLKQWETTRNEQLTKIIDGFLKESENKKQEQEVLTNEVK